MLRCVAAVAFAVGLCLTGCARSIPKTAGDPVGSARVGWVVMVGDRDNPDRDFVCYSESPADCVLPASRPGEQVFADVHLYYHPAAMETKYTGSIQVGFFGSPLELKPTFTVKPKASPENQGIVGIVSDKPGTYPLTIAIDATAIPGGSARQIREQVQFTVR